MQLISMRYSDCIGEQHFVHHQRHLLLAILKVSNHLIKKCAQANGRTKKGVVDAIK